MVPLGEVAEVVSGGTPRSQSPEFWGGDVPWVTPADLSKLAGATIARGSRNITAAGLTSSSARLLPTNSVLLSSRAPIGLVAITAQPLATNQGFKSLVPGEQIDARYLFHWLRSMTSRLNDLGNGATFKELSKATVERLVLPLPELDDQRRIAAILDHADALRAKRREGLTRVDELIAAEHARISLEATASSFVLGEIVPVIANGTSPVCEARPAVGAEFGVLKLGAVTYGEYRAAENKAYLGDPSTLMRNEVMPGDVLMTRKNTPELVGAVTVVDDTPSRRLIPDLVFRLTLDRSIVDPHYFQAAMMSSRVRSRVRSLAGGSAASMSNISKERLRRMRIELPPLETQRSFAQFRATAVAARDGLASSLVEMDALFASLQHRAFQGEL